MAYPVVFDVDSPARFQRVHVLLRLLLWLLLWVVGISLCWIAAVLYLLLPVGAALLLSRYGGEEYLRRAGTAVERILRWLLAFAAYLGLLTDHFPAGAPDPTVHFALQARGAPTVGSALSRLVYALPWAIALAVLGLFSALVWLLAAGFVLASERYPEALLDFQKGVLRWAARLLAYLASLVDFPPPFALDTGPEAVAADQGPRGAT